MNILYKNILALSPIQKLNEKINLHVVDGIIKHSSPDAITPEAGTEIINADELVVAPGFFDMHVHFREPGFEYKEDIKSGCETAANGGFTGVLIMPNTQPSIDNATVIEFINSKSRDNIIDVKIAAALTQNREGRLITPMLELNDYGVKMFTDDGSCVSDSELMRRIFRYATPKDLLISQHCEDHNLTKDFAMNESSISDLLGLKGYPSVAEEIMLIRDIMLAESCGNRRYHASHLSTKGSIQLVRLAKQKGLRITCEVTPHHFSLSDDLLDSYDTNLKINPPLRTKSDIYHIIEGIKDGTVDCIASDHAPHALHEKELEFDHASFGIIGLETSLAISITYLVNNKQIDLNKLVELNSVNPRKILNLDNPLIKSDELANLTIFNPTEEWIVNKNNFKSKSTNSPYIGNKLTGKAKSIINNKKMYNSI